MALPRYTKIRSSAKTLNWQRLCSPSDLLRLSPSSRIFPETQTIDQPHTHRHSVDNVGIPQPTRARRVFDIQRRR